MTLSWSPPDPFMELVYVSTVDDTLHLIVKSIRSFSSCSVCSTTSFRPHSQYTRKVQDLPISEHPVQLLILTRKWFCDNPDCHVKIFTERFEGLSSNGRRTIRAENVLRKIAFSTSCLAAERVAHAVHIPVSHDTLLNLIRKTDITPTVSPFRGNR